MKMEKHRIHETTYKLWGRKKKNVPKKSYLAGIFEPIIS